MILVKVCCRHDVISRWGGGVKDRQSRLRQLKCLARCSCCSRKREKTGRGFHPSVSQRGRNNGPSVRRSELEGRRIRDRIRCSRPPIGQCQDTNYRHQSGRRTRKKTCPKKRFSFYFNCPVVHNMLPKNDLVNVDFSVMSPNGLSRNLMVFPLVRCSLIQLKTPQSTYTAYA